MTHQAIENLIHHQLTTDDWMLDGNCLNGDPEWWFPTPGDAKAIKYAVDLCNTCPVRVRCAEYAIRTNSEWGIYGGLTETQRRQIKENGDAA